MKIVVAFIENDKGQILITQRASNTSYGGYWELPGGKVENQESPQDAIRREIFEELNLKVLDMQWIADFEDDISFSLFHVRKYMGDMQLNAGQIDHCWVFGEQLRHYHFPDRNKHFFELWQSKAKEYN